MGFESTQYAKNMSSSQFRDEEFQFLTEQHTRALSSLAILEQSMQRIESQIHSRDQDCEKVCNHAPCQIESTQSRCELADILKESKHQEQGNSIWSDKIDSTERELARIKEKIGQLDLMSMAL